jgi:UDP-N-acetylmuramoyl-tripeptide--D-alanyl-D-alanine ligase
MKRVDAEALAGAIGAEKLAGAGGISVESVSTDTRTLARGAAYFALRGERFDGHEFLRHALDAGAAALVVDHWPDGLDAKGAAVLRVNDTLLALQRLAYWYRDTLDLPVVAITGSNGKTSTKEFTAAVLGQRFQVNATRGNLNNHIGLPLTVLATEASHTAAVWEMGMNHPGEIAPLCEIAKPKIGIITNIGTAHIEFLGSREGIAEEKGALARALPEDGTLILSAGCDFVEYFRQRTRARVLCVGNGRGIIRAENLCGTETGTAFDLVGENSARARVQLMVSGRHMVANALLAACAGHVLGLGLDEIAAGLQSAAPGSGRLRRFNARGIAVYDDTYNANPDSMAAALETLAEHPLRPGQKHIAVLGDMAELGIHATEGHRRVGRIAAERGILVAAVGTLARDIAAGVADAHGNVEHFSDQQGVAEWLRAHCQEGDAVLFKGSRSSAMERIMNQVFPEN